MIGSVRERARDWLERHRNRRSAGGAPAARRRASILVGADAAAGAGAPASSRRRRRALPAVAAPPRTSGGSEVRRGVVDRGDREGCGARSKLDGADAVPASAAQAMRVLPAALCARPQLAARAARVRRARHPPRAANRHAARCDTARLQWFDLRRRQGGARGSPAGARASADFVGVRSVVRRRARSGDEGADVHGAAFEGGSRPGRYRRRHGVLAGTTDGTLRLFDASNGDASICAIAVRVGAAVTPFVALVSSGGGKHRSPPQRSDGETRLWNRVHEFASSSRPRAPWRRSRARAPRRSTCVANTCSTLGGNTPGTASLYDRRSGANVARFIAWDENSFGKRRTPRRADSSRGRRPRSSLRRRLRADRRSWVLWGDTLCSSRHCCTSARGARRLQTATASWCSSTPRGDEARRSAARRLGLAQRAFVAQRARARRRRSRGRARRGAGSSARTPRDSRRTASFRKTQPAVSRARAPPRRRTRLRGRRRRRRRPRSTGRRRTPAPTTRFSRSATSRPRCGPDAAARCTAWQAPNRPSRGGQRRWRTATAAAMRDDDDDDSGARHRRAHRPAAIAGDRGEWWTAYAIARGDSSPIARAVEAEARLAEGEDRGGGGRLLTSGRTRAGGGDAREGSLAESAVASRGRRILDTESDSDTESDGVLLSLSSGPVDWGVGSRVSVTDSQGVVGGRRRVVPGERFSPAARSNVTKRRHTPTTTRLLPKVIFLISISLPMWAPFFSRSRRDGFITKRAAPDDGGRGWGRRAPAADPLVKVRAHRCRRHAPARIQTPARGPAAAFKPRPVMRGARPPPGREPLRRIQIALRQAAEAVRARRLPRAAHAPRAAPKRGAAPCSAASPTARRSRRPPFRSRTSPERTRSASQRQNRARRRGWTGRR